MAPVSPLLVSLLLPAVAIAATCNADNCLRGLRASSRLAEAQSFCATFTTAAVTTATGIPSFAAQACTGNVISRVSSACSCIATSTSATSSSSTTSSRSTTPLATTAISPSSSLPASSTFVTSTSVSTSPATPSPFPPGPKTCSNTQVSCHNTTVVEDLCCFNAPGGQLLLTEFWDTAPSTGPADAWTLHGLWPDHCDGTYDANCDPSREYSNITAILQSYGKTDLLTYMGTYWKDYQGNDESFWSHEWDKHGTCISTLEPNCYNGYTNQEEVVDYFELAASLYKGQKTYEVLAQAGIVPSTTVTYTFAQFQDALTAAHGFPVTISCSSGQVDEIWYHYNVRGSVQTGEFIPTSPDGAKSDCPTTGIKYVPKYQTSATPTATSSGAISTPTGLPFQGRGFLQAYTNEANKGCLISAGTWYTTGTCATYTAAASADGFTLTSSKGPCGIVAGAFTCATGTTPGVFTNIDGQLAYASSSTFYAAAVPAGSVQQKVYTATNAVNVSFKWQSL